MPGVQHVVTAFSELAGGRMSLCPAAAPGLPLAGAGVRLVEAVSVMGGAAVPGGAVSSWGGR